MKVSRHEVLMLGIWAFAFIVVSAGGVLPTYADDPIEPPPIPADKRLSGPAIVGTLTVTSSGASFIGDCKGNQVTGGDSQPRTVANVTAETMEGIQIAQAGPAGCLSSTGGEDLIINTVTRFTNNGTMAQAEVVILYVVNQ